MCVWFLSNVPVCARNNVCVCVFGLFVCLCWFACLSVWIFARSVCQPVRWFAGAVGCLCACVFVCLCVRVWLVGGLEVRLLVCAWVGLFERLRGCVCLCVLARVHVK